MKKKTEAPKLVAVPEIVNSHFEVGTFTCSTTPTGISISRNANDGKGTNYITFTRAEVRYFRELVQLMYNVLGTERELVMTRRYEERR